MAIIVKANSNDTANQIIRRFKKKIQQEQILIKIREKEFYKRPSIVKKEKLTELKRRKKHFD